MFKKIILSLLILAFASVLILYFFGSKILNKSIKVGVETIGPRITQTPVRLAEVNLSILSGNGQLNGLFVGNPEGFKSENIFALGKIDVDIEPRTLMSDEIVINRIYISEPYISYEKKLKTSNLNELLENIEEYTGGGSDTGETEEPKPEEPAEAESAPGKNILIREFIIEKPNVFIGIIGVGATVPLPSIKLTNIQSSEDKIAALVLSKVISALANNIKEATGNLTGATGNAAGNVLDAASKPLEDVNNSLKEVNEGLKSLFRKKEPVSPDATEENP